MKWLGILCLFLMSTAIGLYASHQLRTRLRNTQRLVELLSDFSTYIRYQCTPLEDLLYLFAEHPNYSSFTFLKDVSSSFSAELHPRTLWQDAVAADAAIVPKAKEIFCALGNTLGTTDMQGQLAALEVHRKHMEELAAELKESCRQKGELYRRLGILLGAMLAVILI